MPSAPSPNAADESSATRRPTPPLTLAVIADVQYADKPATLVINSYGPYVRHYQGCLAVFSRIVRRLNCDVARTPPAPPVGLLHLGDIVDGSPTVARSLADLTTVLRTFDRCRLPVFHVVGNHCLSVTRPVLQRRVAAFRPSFHYTKRLDERWTLVVVDTCDVSVNGTDEERTREAEDWLAAHPNAPNNRRWNGGVGRDQLEWLRNVLESLSHRDGRGDGGADGDHSPRQYAIVATHMPLLPRAADPVHVIFNGDEVSSVLDARCDVVRLVLSGHFHRGGETISDAGVRHKTVRGIVEDGGLEYLTLREDGSFEFASQTC